MDWPLPGAARRRRFAGLPILGRRLRGVRSEVQRPRAAKLTLPRSLRYLDIRAAVMRELERLSQEQRANIRLGTLPEIMVQMALVQLGYRFVAQRPEDGGRLRLGSAVVDMLVYLGARPVTVRVQGDYWHSLPARRRKDAMQLMRLRARGYRVVDLWEHDIYRAWAEGRLRQFVEGALRGAL